LLALSADEQGAFANGGHFRELAVDAEPTQRRGQLRYPLRDRQLQDVHPLRRFQPVGNVFRNLNGL
jgi:hypothetical protein